MDGSKYLMTKVEGYKVVDGNNETISTTWIENVMALDTQMGCLI
jgi:hypothetical protein